MNNIFTNHKDYGGTFLKEFESNLRTSDNLTIASGYIGATTIEDLEDSLISLAKRGKCKILIGMIYHGGVTSKQNKALTALDNKLRAISKDNGVYISRQQYHGKIYEFKSNQNTRLYSGSSNFSKEGFSSRLECTTPIIDTDTKINVSSYLHHLFTLETTILLKDAELRIHRKKKTRTKASKELSDYEVSAMEFPDISNALGTCNIKLRVDSQPRSSFNLYFDKGRKNSHGKYAPRPWYEVEITTTADEISSPYYPTSKLREAGKKARKGSFNAFIQYEDKYYKIKMVVHADNGKNISSDRESGGRETLGRIIKGKLENSGLLSEGEVITSDILDAYGRDYIMLIKISDNSYILDF
jgi:hypothetical protein